ncbi:sialidase family protein [Sphingobacterium psychroaquaticum]|uniref:exo-alpha-sialidase n=1 Tax=Sphingobacterium psychroaquaticum TaxID=561061 RepID=A0A1X7JPI9_9SPHI|nr:sialidase family protein [Sphingobacterium psychroaquaticum]SMG30161.1 sialidase-1 [Sphingobacterium psychroaquaticum]
MMNKLFYIGAALLMQSTLNAQEVTVFKSGEAGYASYRIPAIVKNKNGDLLAFSEGRVDHAGDYGNVDIVYKISKDNGKTWGAIQVAADYEKLQAGNAAPVVDLLDPNYPNGRIFLFYNTGNNHESEIRKGKGLRESWFITSTDGAKTWSAPVNITAETHQPKQPDVNPAYNFDADWRTLANTPGHALQLDSGPYKGRLYIPANHSEGNPLANGKDYYAHSFYSDDHGKTYKIGSTVPFEGSNETMAAQISETGVYMNSRNQQGNVRTRIISYSNNGGVTWDTTFYDKNLPDPVNQGSVLSWRKKGKYILAVCNAADTKNRDNLTLRLSKDGGKTWYKNTVVAKAPAGYKGSYSAYSDLVLLNPKTIGVFYEKDNYKEIVFIPVKL